MELKTGIFFYDEKNDELKLYWSVPEIPKSK